MLDHVAGLADGSHEGVIMDEGTVELSKRLFEGIDIALPYLILVLVLVLGDEGREAVGPLLDIGNIGILDFVHADADHDLELREGEERLTSRVKSIAFVLVAVGVIDNHAEVTIAACVEFIGRPFGDAGGEAIIEGCHLLPLGILAQRVGAEVDIIGSIDDDVDRPVAITAVTRREANADGVLRLEHINLQVVGGTIAHLVGIVLGRAGHDGSIAVVGVEVGVDVLVEEVAEVAFLNDGVGTELGGIREQALHRRSSLEDYALSLFNENGQFVGKLAVVHIEVLDGLHGFLEGGYVGTGDLGFGSEVVDNLAQRIDSVLHALDIVVLRMGLIKLAGIDLELRQGEEMQHFAQGVGD